MAWTAPSGITHSRGVSGPVGSVSAFGPAAQRKRWAAGLALATGLGLLMAFNHVVRQGVEQGAARRLATSVQADEGWRCGTAKGARARADCLMGAPETRMASRGSAP